MTRLCLGVLDRVPTPLIPPYDPRAVGVGILHLGPGAFHRAHQAAFTHALLADEPDGPGICAVATRSRTVVAALAAQDGLFTLITRGGPRPDTRVIAAIREARHVDDDRDIVLDRFADPRIMVCTTTITEAGYRDGEPSIALLVDGLRARFERGGAPFALLSCDNLPDNGAVLRAVVLAGVRDDALGDWIEQSVRFPSSVVDRIVPAPGHNERAEARRATGFDDQSAVAAESYGQWVIEDGFCGPRPAWERVGVVLTADVTPYQRTKLRLLNGSHTALALLGSAAGAEDIATTLRLPGALEFARTLALDELALGLITPAGVTPGGYVEQVLARFADPAIRHATDQVAADSARKLPVRLLPALRVAHGTGQAAPLIVLVLAAWLHRLWRRRDDAGRPLTLHDPAAEAIGVALRGIDSPVAAVETLWIAPPAPMADDLAALDGAWLRTELVTALAELDRHGAGAVLAGYGRSAASR